MNDPGPAPASDAKGAVMSTLTDREALALREGQLRGILEGASEAIITVDQSQTIVMANAMAATIFGRSNAALVGRPLALLIPERLRAGHAAAVAAFGAADAPPRRMGGRGELVGLRANGEEFPLEAGISQAHADGQRLYTVILRDLSDARRAASALHTSEELLAATFSTGSVGMAQVDPATRRFLSANAAFCALCGYTEAELRAMTVDRLDPPGEHSCLELMRAPPPGRSHWEAEHRLRRRDGSLVWVETSIAVARDEAGQPLRAVCVSRDVTAHRAALAALKAREARLAFLVQLNDRLRQLTAPGDIGYEASCLLGRFADADRVGYAEDDGDGIGLTVARNYTRGVQGIEGRYRYLDFGAALTGALHAGRTVVQPDIAADATLGTEIKARHAALQLAATVNVPLVQNGRLVAVLFVHSHTPRQWTPDEVALFEDVAARVRADIVRSRAEAGVRATKAKLEAALASMNDAVCISDAQGVITDANAAFASFHRLRDADKAPPTLQEYAALLEVTQADGTVTPLDQWAIPRALRGERGSSQEYSLMDRRTGERWIGSYSFAPILDREGRVVGSVCNARDITEQRRILAELEASQAQLRSLIAAQDKVQEQERLRIARELHDDLQQNLAAILMETEVVRAQARAVDERVREALRRIEQLAKDVVGSMRHIVHDLRPPALEDLGLVAAIRALAASFSERTAIPCRVEATAFERDSDDGLAPVATCVYRVVQEALTNVARHAGARQAQVRLQPLPDQRLCVTVSDDGVGIHPQALHKPDSFGLLGMRERVRACGGTLRTRSAATGGTVVEAVLPLAQRSAAPAR